MKVIRVDSPLKPEIKIEEALLEMKRSMIKEGEHLYNQTRKSVSSVKSVATEKSPRLPQPPTSTVQSQYKMASSQPTHSGDKGENVQNT
ncbi:MAG: hypothetical protein RI580_19350, partial [Halothece sp. Uz-M2-17]|nr:hypothetical protein [Halothece sp. Uz-M2-17]